jgi:hypothetical protein
MVIPFCFVAIIHLCAYTHESVDSDATPVWTTRRAILLGAARVFRLNNRHHEFNAIGAAEDGTIKSS